MRWILISALVASAVPASAEPSFSGGAYGDKEGCKSAKTGEPSGADVFFLLTSEGITTAASYCAIKKVVKKSASSALTIECEAEGESGGEETVEAVKTAKGYVVTFSDGTHWGPLPKCR